MSNERKWLQACIPLSIPLNSPVSWWGSHGRQCWLEHLSSSLMQPQKRMALLQERPLAVKHLMLSLVCPCLEVHQPRLYQALPFRQILYKSERRSTLQSQRHSQHVAPGENASLCSLCKTNAQRCTSDKNGHLSIWAVCFSNPHTAWRVRSFRSSVVSTGNDGL